MAVSATSGSSSSTSDYTQSSTVSNDELTSNDFMMLMLQQLKLQDPTKPYDSQQMLTTQMQMSTLSSNLSMVKAMDSIKEAFQQTAISNVASLVGKTVEDGKTNDDGTQKVYTIESVENYDNKLVAIGREWLYLYNGIQLNVKGDDGAEDKITTANYDENGNIYDEKGNQTGYTIVLEEKGKPKLDDDGNLIIKDEDGNIVEFHEYELSGKSTVVLSDETTEIPFEDIKKIS